MKKDSSKAEETNRLLKQAVAKSERDLVANKARELGKPEDFIAAADAVHGAIMDAIDNGVLQQPRGAFTKTRITQSKGPTYRGDMRQIAYLSTQRDGRPDYQELEIWETPKGNWITVFYGFGRGEFVRAEYLKDVRPDDLDFQLTVWASLEYATAARAMLRDQFGWKFLQEVE